MKWAEQTTSEYKETDIKHLEAQSQARHLEQRTSKEFWWGNILEDRGGG